MKLVLGEISLTFKSLILSSFIKNGKDFKSEKIQKTFLNISDYAKFSCGNKFYYVIEIIKKQLKK